MYIYRTINWLAAAIHTADPAARVTSGAWTFQVSSTRNFSGGGHFYSNSSLMAAGGKANGTVDFYEVHYYGQRRRSSRRSSTAGTPRTGG